MVVPFALKISPALAPFCGITTDALITKLERKKSKTSRDMGKKIQRAILFPFILLFSFIGILSAKIADKLIKASGVRGKIEFNWFFE